MGKDGGLNKQITLRANGADVARIDRLAELLSARMAGVEVNRSTAARAAILKGLDAFEAELGITKAKKTAKRSKGAAS